MRPAVSNSNPTGELTPAVASVPIDASCPQASASCRAELQRVMLPVTVVLAHQRAAVQQIVQLAPGSILRFDKSHRAPLELRVGGRPLAAGQCVEIGRRLGLVITRK